MSVATSRPVATLMTRGAALGVTLGLLLGAGACTPVRGHQGYIVDADLVNSVQPGVDNRQSVQATLGRPSFVGQFDQSEWFYIARDSRNLAFNNPKVHDQLTLKISFDQAGVVRAVGKGGVEQVASISPSDKSTPTLGRNKSFFQELFGNIGSVGAGGPGGGPGGADGRP